VAYAGSAPFTRETAPAGRDVTLRPQPRPEDAVSRPAMASCEARAPSRDRSPARDAQRPAPARLHLPAETSLSARTLGRRMQSRGRQRRRRRRHRTPTQGARDAISGRGRRR
jgi:hypothetical protein